MKYEAKQAKPFCAVKKYPDGGEAVMEYFETRDAADAWIAKQPSPKGDSFVWMVGEWSE